MIFRSFLSASIDRGIGNRSDRCRKIIFAKRSKINGASAENCSGPENRDASISLRKLYTNAMIFSTVLEHLDRSRRPHRSNRRRKIYFRFCSKINANPKKIVRAPKISMRRFYQANTMQTLRNLRPFFSTAIDRGVHIDRIGVEKSILIQ